MIDPPPSDQPPPNVTPLAYETPAPGRKRTSWAVLLILVIVIVLLFLCTLTSMGTHSVEPGNRVQCANNLQRICLALRLYAMDNGDQFPPTLDLVLLLDPMKVVDANCLICPSSQDFKAPGSTPAQQAAAIRSNPAHCSYIYLPPLLPASSIKPDQILAYENSSNHNKEGMNILFGDGRVQWHGAIEAAYVLSELSQGHNPPRPKP